MENNIALLENIRVEIDLKESIDKIISERTKWEKTADIIGIRDGLKQIEVNYWMNKPRPAARIALQYKDFERASTIYNHFGLYREAGDLWKERGNWVREKIFYERAIKQDIESGNLERAARVAVNSSNPSHFLRYLHKVSDETYLSSYPKRL